MQGHQKALATVVALFLAAALFAQSSQSSPARAKKAATRRGTVTVKDIEELRAALAAQQEQIQQLRQEMQSKDSALQDARRQAEQAQQQLQQAQSAAGDAQQKALIAQSAAEQQKENLDRINSTLADLKTSLVGTAVTAQDEQKRVSALESLVGRFRLNGDIRIRGESFFQDYKGFEPRNRARVRVRFGFDGRLNEDFSGSVAMATGSLGDPTTTNETFTNFFDRKSIGLDKAYITYNPVAHNWLSATGGKFPYLWQRTQMTGDPDLNPEGFDVKLSFNTQTPLVKNVTVQAFNTLFNEVTSGSDSYALGGQIAGKLEAGPWTATASYMAEKWNGTSALLQASGFAVQATTVGFSNGGTTTTIPATGEGPGCAKGSGSGGSFPTVPPCAFAPNGETNAVTIGADGKPRFLSGFFYSDFILSNQIKTGMSRLPLNLLLEFEENLDAANHPYDTGGKLITSLGKQNQAYLADISVGQTKNQNDIQVGYAWLREEQDAALAAFAESDQRAPTNILQHRVYALWKVRANTVAGLTWWHGRTLNSNLQNNPASLNKTITKAGQTEPFLNRFQFDLIYTF
ncbi:MAG TPA: putative porin [Terriglobales bacterium]|nr:putative porin [Terriglobales bacterium]